MYIEDSADNSKKQVSGMQNRLIILRDWSRNIPRYRM